MHPIKKVHVIINPASGKKEPVLSWLNDLLTPAHIDWAVTVTRKPNEVFETARLLLDQPDLDAIAVYGGDGTVMEAARALHTSPMLLAILPGGTANVMAKELDLPLETKDAIRLLTTADCRIKEIDMGLVNDCPFLIRLNMGILSDMVTETSDEMKDKWGQWAYGITAFQSLPQESTTFQLTIDGRKFTREAVALTVTNAGNVGRKGYSFLPGISISDGLLDVIALDKANMLSLLKITGSMLLHTDSAALQHWTAKEVTIRTGRDIPFLLDDTARTAATLTCSISPASLRVIIPNK